MKNAYLLLLLLPFFSFTQNSFLIKIPFPDQVSMADIIVEGKVIHKKSYWDVDHKNIYTVHTVEVSKLYKGSAAEQIHISTLGGTIGFEVQTSYPTLPLNINDTGVFLAITANIMLEGFNPSDQIYETIGVSQGFYRYNLEKESVTSPFLNFDKHTKLHDTITAITGKKVLKLKKINYFKKDKRKASLRRSTMKSMSAKELLSPSKIVAGNKSVLSIRGSEFGTTIGKVSFPHADSPAALTIDALDSQIISWSDTEIKVEVPGKAGSGSIKVETSRGGAYMYYGLEITLAYRTIRQSSIYIQDGAEIEYPVHHIGGYRRYGKDFGNFKNQAYIFNYNTDFKNNALAVNSFERGFTSFICEAGMNFSIDEPTTDAKVARDNINVICFDKTAAGILGLEIDRIRVERRITGDGVKAYYFAVEKDYEFNEDILWSFEGVTPATEYDFNYVVRHETGHAAGLGHVIDTDKMMHYAAGTGSFHDILSDPVFDAIREKIESDIVVISDIPSLGDDSKITPTALAECYPCSCE